ncbi:hypothetical protein DEH69_03740 [Streptomyces sp. PT12]|nr:hypothetical protein DEH69_03740 [Streptomyces sp. PT12]
MTAMPTKTFWCEAIALNSTTGHPHWLGAHATSTPRLALRWIRTRALAIRDQVDTPERWLIDAWLRDDREHQYALDLLTTGGMYAHTIHEHALHYLLTARPIPRTAAHQPGDTCMHEYAREAADAR